MCSLGCRVRLRRVVPVQAALLGQTLQSLMENLTLISALPASGSFDTLAIPAENTVIFCKSAGSGPIISMPATGFSSLTCCRPISASPLETSTLTRLSGPPMASLILGLI